MQSYTGDRVGGARASTSVGFCRANCSNFVMFADKDQEFSLFLRVADFAVRLKTQRAVESMESKSSDSSFRLWWPQTATAVKLWLLMILVSVVVASSIWYFLPRTEETMQGYWRNRNTPEYESVWYFGDFVVIVLVAASVAYGALVATRFVAYSRSQQLSKEALCNDRDSGSSV